MRLSWDRKRLIQRHAEDWPTELRDALEHVQQLRSQGPDPDVETQEPKEARPHGTPGWDALVRTVRVCRVLELDLPALYADLEAEIGHTFKADFTLADLLAEADRLDDPDPGPTASAPTRPTVTAGPAATWRKARSRNKLKQFRAVATRSDKRLYVFQGSVTAAALVIWLRTLATD